MKIWWVVGGRLDVLLQVYDLVGLSELDLDEGDDGPGCRRLFQLEKDLEEEEHGLDH